MPLLAASDGLLAATIRSRRGLPQASELALPNMERLADNVWVKPLSDQLWITSFTSQLSSGIWYPANGLIVRDVDGLTFVDPGWDPISGARLLRYAREKIGAPVVRAIATHFHADRVGGLAPFQQAGISTLAHPLTSGLARADGQPAPDPVQALADGPVSIGPVELFFPGVGHTRDNIVVWHESSRTLFGGCLIKSASAPDMGNLADGDIRAYPQTLAAVQARYPRRKATVPGHGTVAGDALAHSQALVARALSKA